MAAVSQRVLLAMLGTKFTSFIELPANGSSGGVLVAWKHSLGPPGQHCIDTHSISIQSGVAAGQPWWLTCVYGPQGNEDKI
jgi:hypothetical protein